MPKKFVKKSTEINYDSALQNHMVSLVKSNLDFVNRAEREFGPQFADELILHSVSKLLGVLAYKTLTAKIKGVRDDKLEDIISSNFRIIRMASADAIADAFSAAMTTFCKKPVDYYCKIEAVPDPESDMVN
jgi:hypothetical protein